MCGLLSVINNTYNNESLNHSLSLMKHRGPDNMGEFCIDNNYFGHQRLSIIDLNNRSNQPLTIDGITIVYNGEIYNYKELIKDYNLQVITGSDTEVIILMYKKFGVKCLEYFNGMFAFVIYDNRKKDVFVARDRLGIKPLYYKKNDNGTIYSSEISSILDLSESEISDFGLRQYQKFRMTLNNDTIYKDIYFFPPGYYSFNGKLVKYWDLEIDVKDPPSYEELEHTIRDSVSIRNRADVSVGSYLSGGLDSTILSFILKPSNTWTVGFESLNEFEWASLANQTLKSDHFQRLVDKEEFISTAEFMITKRREPLSVPNEVLIYLMTEKVKEKNTVVLSGEGADELFWGYDRIFSFYNQNHLTVENFDKYYCYGSNEDFEIIDYAFDSMKSCKTDIDKIAYFFQKHHLHGLLRRLDNSTMLCSVEARVPFVDHRLVEMMAGTSYKWRMGETIKSPLKKIFFDLLPKGIINRKKVGFPVPLNEIYEQNNAKNSFDHWLEFNLKFFN